MAGDVLEPTVAPDARTTKLLLSSEWDYSPFTYPNIRDLPKFLFIGLPAPESSNPLTLPLAGHELGHSVWEAKAFKAAHTAKAKQGIIAAITGDWKTYIDTFHLNIAPKDLTTDLAAIESWSLALAWCLRQIEETFCDFLGLRLFGTSYLHAFAYVLSPGTGGRTVWYPSMPARVANLTVAAHTYGVKTPAGYQALFLQHVSGPLAQVDRYRVGIADKATASLIPDLIKLANDVVSASALEAPSAAEELRVLERFVRVVPAEQCASIVDIVNAGWAAFLDDNFWKDLPTIKPRKNEILKELVLKNLEIFEIEHM
jgi:hypothetical protein